MARYNLIQSSQLRGWPGPLERRLPGSPPSWKPAAIDYDGEVVSLAAYPQRLQLRSFDRR
jgi:hypothetical protein